jgi:uncharacterized protein
MKSRSALLATAVLVATCAAFGPRVLAGEVRFGSVLPNGAMYVSHVESMQESRFRYIVRQHTDYSCGAAALATILRYAYHLDVDERTVIEGMLGVSDPQIVEERGFSLLDIKHYVESLGMRGRGYRVTVDRLKTVRIPTLVLMDVRGFRHFVVLKRVNSDSVEVADPILGNRTLPLDEFLAAWPSRAIFAVIGSGFDRKTVLMRPMTTPSARRLFAAQGPISDAELLDFGFTHADLF